MRGMTALRRSLEELARLPADCSCPREWRGRHGETHRWTCARMVWLRAMARYEGAIGDRSPMLTHARRVIKGTDRYGQWQWDGEAKRWVVVFDEEEQCAA